MGTVAVRAAVVGLQLVYDVVKLGFPVRHRVTLASRLYPVTSQDMGALRRVLRRLDPTVDVAVLNHRSRGLLSVPYNVLSEIYHLATSEAVVVDSYIMPVSALRHREGLRVVQMWHALGAVKKFGLAAVGTDEGRAPWAARALRMHEGYDFVIAGSERMVGPFAEAFGVGQDQVLPLGTPRVDMLSSSTQVARRAQKVRDRHPGLGHKPVVLYAPTFRKGEPVAVEPLLDSLDTDAFDVVVALHPLDLRQFGARPGVFQDPSLSTLDWLCVADHVITDYSAVVFDAAVLDLPMYFYAYDLDEYTTDRGLFLDYAKDMPGPVLRTAAEVARSLAEDQGSRPHVAAFRDEFVARRDGRCTRRIARLALGASPEEL